MASKSRVNDRHFKMNISQALGIERGKKYFVISFDTNEIFMGRFDNWDDTEDILGHMYDTYSNIPGRKYHRHFNNHYFTCNKKYKFTECDYYYDVKPFKNEIKRKAENAIKQMEQRSLNMILKRLINEEFQW
jgi:hypothetical protein